jgi:hypothetical protein
MKKKMRKFAEGGYETAEGENENIKEDTRSRARKFIEEGSPEQDTGEKPVTVTKTKTSVTASKPKGESADDYKERMETMTKKQGLERVEPENYIPGSGLLKGMLKSAVRAGEKDIARTITTKAGKEIPVKQSKPDFSGSAKEGMGMKSIKNKSGKEIPVTKMKSGGSVKSSQLSKANGIAQRGLTRGKMC